MDRLSLEDELKALAQGAMTAVDESSKLVVKARRLKKDSKDLGELAHPHATHLHVSLCGLFTVGRAH